MANTLVAGRRICHTRLCGEWDRHEEQSCVEMGRGVVMENDWDRQSGETAEWYDRFLLYLYMGPDRTVAAAHNFATRLAKGAAPGHLSSWQRAARRHQWKQRAAAFDGEVTRKLPTGAATPEARTVRGDGAGDVGQGTAGDEERLRMVVELLHQVYEALRHADLATMSKEEARQLLPTFRLFFRDLLQLHQTEVAQLLAGGEGDAALLNADLLVKFVKEEEGIQKAATEIKRVTEAMHSEKRWQPLRDVLAQLYPDEASARRIAAQAQLDSARIHFAPRAVDSWHAILTEAAHMGLMESVIAAAQQEYRANVELAKAVQHYRQAEPERKVRPKRNQQVQGKTGQKARARQKA
jgi:predicted DNA-binding protein (UPF0251 family)